MKQEVSTVRGVVRSIQDGFAEVEVEQGGCGRCHEEGGCGGQQLTQIFCSGPRSYRVPSTSSVIPGDRVTVAIAAGAVRQTANLIYGVPLICVLGGSIFGALIASETGAILGCLGGLLVGFGLVSHLARRASGALSAKPYIVGKN